MSVLLKAINSSDTVISISPDPTLPIVDGLVIIDTEQISYESNYLGTLYGCTRGVNSTTPASHAVGAQLTVLSYFFAAAVPTGVAWGGITGTLSNQSDLQTALNAKLTLSATNSATTGFTEISGANGSTGFPGLSLYNTSAFNAANDISIQFFGKNGGGTKTSFITMDATLGALTFSNAANGSFFILGSTVAGVTARVPSNRDFQFGDNAEVVYSFESGSPGYARLILNNDSNPHEFRIQGGVTSLLNGVKYHRTTTAVSYQILVSDYEIGVTNTGSARTITLPAPASAGVGATYIVKDESGGAGTNHITIVPNASETIDGGSSIVIMGNYGALTLICDGTNWFTIAAGTSAGGISLANYTLDGVSGTPGGTAAATIKPIATNAPVEFMLINNGSSNGGGSYLCQLSDVNNTSYLRTFWEGDHFAILSAKSGTGTDVNLRIGLNSGNCVALFNQAGSLDLTGALNVSSTLHSSAGRKVARTATATSYSILVSDDIIAVTDTSAARTITLPAPATVGAGSRYTVKDESGAAGTNHITITQNAAEKIDGANTLVISTNYGVARLYTDGTNWFTI